MIENYNFGKIVINGVAFRKDVIITPDKVIPDWWRRKGHELAVADIQNVVEKYQPEILVVGTGKFGMMKILPETQGYLQKNNIHLIAEKSERACQLFNSESEKANVVGAFHLTC